MSFWLFLPVLIVTLFAFAIVAYLRTGSLWSTFIQTLTCGILLQIGYFLVVMLLVWRSDPETSATPKSQIARKKTQTEKLPSDPVSKAGTDHSPPPT